MPVGKAPTFSGIGSLFCGDNEDVATEMTTTIRGTPLNTAELVSFRASFAAWASFPQSHSAIQIPAHW